ncbi:MAG: MATE family efflux transporter [Erysipelotrichaceae bacterium]|nr:MATE family efflux transporter [Erysipelotrichaceae bacterium]MDY5251148.1 MATE family efflux transporter [Erysipelotrichaceae bacterium]
MNNDVAPMTTGSIAQKIVLFALPIFIGNLFQQMYNTVDSLIVGNYLGSNALAAVSSSGNLIFMLIGFFTGIATGAGVIIARLYGANDREHLSKAVHTSIALGLVSGIILTIIGVFFSGQILIWMQTPESVMVESLAYLQMYFWGSLGFVMYNIFVGILQAIGDSKHPLYYLILSSIINLILDIIFIRYGQMGVAGAALATIISQFISAICCLWQLLHTQAAYKVNLRLVRFDLPLLKEIIQIGIPSGIQNSIIGFANVIVQANINSFGALAMAGYGAYTKIEGFGFLPITSFTLALTTFVGQNIGAQQYERTKKGARFGIIATLILAQLIGIFIFIFAPSLIAAFDQNPDVISFGIAKARSCTLFYFLLAYSHALASILRGAGKATVPMMVMMICWCVIRVSFLSITIPLTHDILMVYIVYPLTWFLSSVCFFVYYHRSNWLSSPDKSS